MTQAVIFDLDGTLLNTLGDLTVAVNHALTVCGLPTRTESEIRSFIGDGVKQLITRSCPPDTDDSTIAAVLAENKAYYAAHNMDLTAPYADVVEILESLRWLGIRTAVVSNKQEPSVKKLCAHYFDGLLDAAVGGSDARPLKPAPDSLLYVMEQLGVTADEVWYVGDSVQDIETARAAGVRCVAVTWGYQDADRLAAAQPAVLANDAQAVLKAVM